ncbi:AT-rich interactive domain-containing protein 5B [Scleropages formosus]|uniref:Zgc:77151 n=1 Tax=Scleropages formosus TaxID=113540 RepID=A0A8C9V2S6_SCLFO|nr:AT-rich interactive domain-containing protein 5B-like [Scleropages formosus]
MEHNAIQWLGAPCCLRGSFAFYRSFSCRPEGDSRAAVWKLGDFYFVRCAPQEPVCIAEVALLWEDRAQRHQLASSRLYFLPEDTPKGRMSEHGEDEVLAVSKKIVIRIEDLVKWACPEPASWKGRCRGVQHVFAATSGTSGTLDGKYDGAASQEQWRVKVLSYPQYCRFRSLQRRLQDRAGYPRLQDPHLLALGGMRVSPHNTWVLYCRDTFNHPTLDSNTSVWTHLGCTSLSLKGRPRKRRGRDGKGLDQENHNQSVASWIERMKESVMGSVELPCEGSWLPHPEEQHFLDQLYVFMERRGSPIGKVPNLGFKKIDLFLLFSTVKKLGGYERVTSERLWKQVYNELGGSPGSTSAATCTRRHYERLMLAYEQHLKGGGGSGSAGGAGGGGSREYSQSQGPVASRKSSELQKGRESQVPSKKKMNGETCPMQDSTMKPRTAEVRRRGRPPSKRSTRPTAKTLSKKPCPDSARGALPPSSRRRSFQPLYTPPPQDLSSVNDSIISSQDLRAKQSIPVPHAALFHPRMERAVMTTCEEPVNLCPSGPLGAFSLCPISLFRTRLGLTTEQGPGTATQETGVLQPSVLIVHPKTEPSEQLGPTQGSLNGFNDGTPRGGASEARPRSAVLPPLRIIPLDIDCSLQVHQFMKSRVGPAELSSFTRRLSEVLAQDLSKACEPPGGAQASAQEQALPLNLSKRCTAKRPGEDPEARGHGGDSSKRTKLDVDPSDNPGQVLKQRKDSVLLHEVQEEPADLSCPKRARAAAQGQDSRFVTGLESAAGSARLSPGSSSPSQSEGGRVLECTPRVPGLPKQVEAKDDPSGAPYSLDSGRVVEDPKRSSSGLSFCHTTQPGSLQALPRWPPPSQSRSDPCRNTDVHTSSERRSLTSSCVSTASLTLPLAETK